MTEPEPYNDVIIAYRNGAPVRVRDVGQAVGGPQDVTLGALPSRSTGDHAADFQAARRQRDRDGR